MGKCMWSGTEMQTASKSAAALSNSSLKSRKRRALGYMFITFGGGPGPGGAAAASAWLAGFAPGDLHPVAVSHGEGKVVVSEKLARELFAAGQVAFQYVGPDGRPTTEAPWNPNGSSYAIEGITSRDGRILGKMGHTERWEEHLFKNIAGNKRQDLFGNAVSYFRKVKSER